MVNYMDRNKTLIYLDQWFISNLAKAHIGILPNPKSAKLYRELYDLLYDKIHNKELVVCPESAFHQEETLKTNKMPPALADAIQETISRLSWGISTTHWIHTVHFQTSKALHKYAKEDLSPITLEWIDVLFDNPNSSTKGRSVKFGGTDLIVNLKWHRSRKDYDQEKTKCFCDTMKDVIKELSENKTSLSKQIEEELRAFLDHFYFNAFYKALKAYDKAFYDVNYASSEEFCNLMLAGTELTYLHAIWKGIKMGDEPKKTILEDINFISFFKSFQLRTVPFLKIQSCLNAALVILNPNRNPKTSDVDDVLIISQLLPYCDVMLLDSDMREMLKKLFNKGFLGEFKDRLIVGASLVELEKLKKYLTNLN